MNHVGDKNIGRFLIDAESSFSVMSDYFERTGVAQSAVQRSLSIDLDDVYSANPSEFKANYDNLVNKVAKSGVSTVYLKAFSDNNHDGVVDAVYFPNKTLSVKADLFSQVAWQLKTRAGVNVYAWMPATLNNFPASTRSEQKIEELYKDLAFYSKSAGILFDTTLNKAQPESVDGNTQHFIDRLIQATAPYLYFCKDEQGFAISISGNDLTHTLNTLANKYNSILIENNYDRALNEDVLDETLSKITASNAAKNKINLIIDSDNNAEIDNQKLIKMLQYFEEKSFMNFGLALGNYELEKNNLEEVKPYISINRNITKK